ncbi:hypothetical protein DFS34DRAFT_480724 [Phlyctochytrium arcticum]|nr:hypothetical protein DFS34DRAFT_480724 [Phlyctochytrium arcticum]
MLFPLSFLNITLANAATLGDAPSARSMKKRAVVTYSQTCPAGPTPSDSRCWSLATPYLTLSNKAYLLTSIPYSCIDATFANTTCSQFYRKSDGKLFDQITTYGTADIKTTESTTCRRSNPALLAGVVLFCKNSVMTVEALAYLANFATIDTSCTMDSPQFASYTRLTCVCGNCILAQ